MPSRSPSYLTKNHLGIYLFQYRTPQRLLQPGTEIAPLFRKSLGTRDRHTALTFARRWVVLMDELAMSGTSEQPDYSDAQRILRQQWVRVPPSIIELEGLIKNGCAIASVGNQSQKPEPPRILAALETYLTEKKKTWNPKSHHSNERDIRLKVETFADLLGNPPCHQITAKHMAQYKADLFKLPSNRTKRKPYRDMDIRELLDLNIPDSHRLGGETLTNHFNKVSAFLDWCYRNDLTKANLKLPIQRVITNSKSATQQRDVFNDEDLTRLFNSKQYLNGTHRKPSHYFVPLIGLFSGARLNEICQLYRSDIYQESNTGIWVMDINSNGADKRLKKASHARLVPIHPTLIELGLIDHIQSLTDERAFKDLKFKRDGYAQTFSKWFNNTYRNTRNCNVGQLKAENKNFHSFRHGFITQMSNVHHIPQHKIAHIVGHKPNDGSETIQRYTKPTDLEDRQRIISRIEWQSIDFMKICRFDNN